MWEVSDTFNANCQEKFLLAFFACHMIMPFRLFYLFFPNSRRCKFAGHWRCEQLNFQIVTFLQSFLRLHDYIFKSSIDRLIFCIHQSLSFGEFEATGLYCCRRGERLWFHAVECTPSHSNMDCVWRATHVAPKVQNSPLLLTTYVNFSVADPNPDPYICGPSGSVYFWASRIRIRSH